MPVDRKGSRGWLKQGSLGSQLHLAGNTARVCVVGGLKEQRAVVAKSGSASNSISFVEDVEFEEEKSAQSGQKEAKDRQVCISIGLHFR